MNQVLFIQKRTHRAGAQSCLARLVAHDGLRDWHPVLVCDRAGWLTEECARQNIPVILEPFPSSRSLSARLLGNSRWARAVAKQMTARKLHPNIIQANDHLEGLLGLALAKEFQAKSAMFLRSPGMTRSDYSKYGCREYDFLSAVGEELRERALSWAPDKPVELIHDGICEGEFSPPKLKPATFPTKILVIGSPLDWKGWADLTEALFQWQESGGMPALEFHFTGTEPEPAKNDLKLGRMRSGVFQFLGRRENFKELVREYDLAINATWHESFGMAAIETLAAGVPLLSSRSGVIEQVITQPEFLFAPRQPASLAAALKNLLGNWSRADIDLASCQKRIRQKFMLATTAEKITRAYAKLVG